MSAVTNTLSLTLGLLGNESWDAARESPREGSVSDTRIREALVKELDDFEIRITGPSRKDFLRIYTYLREGVQLLNAALDKSKGEQKAVVNEDNDDGGITASSTMPSGGNSDILDHASQLSQAMQKLKGLSSRSKTAKDKFKRSHKLATHAFCNEALSIEDRILAAKLRVISETLECLDSPDTAVTSCLLFLSQIHDLPAVREMFWVYLGRVNSTLEKTDRVENIKSIMMTNYVLYQFAFKFSDKYYSPFSWPTIQLSDRAFNPICSWREVSTRASWGGVLTRPPNEVIVDKGVFPDISAVNGQGEIVVGNHDGVQVISTSGKSKLVLPLSVPTRPIIRISGLAVDMENCVYFLLHSTSRNKDKESHHAVLFLLDEHCKYVKHKSKLNFLPELDYLLVTLAVNKNKDIVMSMGIDWVYVCNINGQLKYKFQPKSSPYFIDILDNNEIIIASCMGSVVEIYTEEGNLKKIITLPESHEIYAMAFHWVLGKIIVLSKPLREDSYFLHCYSEKGEQCTSTFLGNICHTESRHSRITSHPSGPAAIVTEKTILYI